MKLAINGGTPVRDKEKYFPKQYTIADKEWTNVQEVLQSEILSAYRGSYIPAFMGGPMVKRFERSWAEKFGTEYCMAVNSCTSALQIACGAIGIEPGDEVIVTPWSMSCSATAPMMWGGVPVFADIEGDNFCLDIQVVARKITPRTKAIIAVDLFGQPCDPALRTLADKHHLFLIEDAAQAPGARSNGSFTGNIGHIGCFSFTQGKHMTSGEGGMITTNDPELARKCQLIRNHAEAVISSSEGLDAGWFNWNNMVGSNMRMTEIQAGIMLAQLDKLNSFIELRRFNVAELNKIAEIPAIHCTEVRPGSTHTYYVQSFYWEDVHIHRDKFIEAVKAELTYEEGRLDKGVPIGCGYIQPLYRMPLFQNAQHWTVQPYKEEYKETDCVIAEQLWKDKLFLWTLHGLPLSKTDVNDIVNAFQKVWENREEIK